MRLATICVSTTSTTLSFMSFPRIRMFQIWKFSGPVRMGQLLVSVVEDMIGIDVAELTAV